MTDHPLYPIRDAADIDAACGEPLAVIYKHSPRCGMSAMALRQVLAFAERHPDVPVYLVDVVGQRPLSQSLAARLDVRHESPQAIVVQEGAVRWHDSHTAVTAEALAHAVAAADQAG